MDNEIDITPSEIIDIHRDGQRSGFIAGVIFCVTAKYLWNRRGRREKINGVWYDIKS